MGKLKKKYRFVNAKKVTLTRHEHIWETEYTITNDEDDYELTDPDFFDEDDVRWFLRLGIIEKCK